MRRIGIAPEALPHVFDEFRQVGRGQAKAEGTGVGLALAKRFLELHGGKFGVESELTIPESVLQQVTELIQGTATPQPERPSPTLRAPPRTRGQTSRPTRPAALTR